MKRKLKGFFAISTAFYLFMSGLTPALAETPQPEEDLYVLNFSGTDIEGYEDYDQAYMYPSPHVNYLVVDENGDGINESHWNWTGHKTMNMINTTLLKEGGSGPYASTSVYCLDAITDGHRGHKYKRVNLEDSTYFSDEKAQRLRAVLRNSFPYETDMEALEKRINDWNPATDSNAIDLTEAECITATQSVIWHIVNGVEIRKPYLETVKTRFTTSDCMYPEYLLDPEKASDSNATNIGLLVDYLLDLESEEANNSVISENSFVDTEIVYYIDINKTLLTTKICADIIEDTEIYFQANYKDIYSEKILVEDGCNEYGVLFDGKIDNSTITLILEGKQYGEGVFLYEPYYENGKSARSASQTMAGYSAWTLPVKAEIKVNFETIEEDTSIPEETTTAPIETSKAEEPTTTVPETTAPTVKETTMVPTTTPETRDPVEEVEEIKTTEPAPAPTETLPVETEEIIPTEENNMGVLGAMDEDGKLAVLPATGDTTGYWGLLAIISAIGFFIVSFSPKFKKIGVKYEI